MRRREFLRAAGLAGLGSLTPSLFARVQARSGQPIPKSQGKSRMGVGAPKLDKVRLGFIGVGARGPTHVASCLNIEGCEIVAICDLYEDWANRAVKMCTDAGRTAPAIYTSGPYDFKRMNERDDIDVVVISTPWEWHVPMAVDAMSKGKHALVEVPAATTVDECWQLVDAAEKNQVHCMMLENVNYGREELLVLNMCRKGVFGELLHGEAAYIHDLRGQMHEVERGTGSWRTYHYARRNGNLYPTHGLGPVSQYMNINRGDRFDFISSVSSNSRVRAKYAKEKFAPDHKWNSTRFTAGDINTSIIKSVLGRTIMVQWDEQLPRPYTRHNLIQGTEGIWAGFPNRCVIENVSKSTHSWDQAADLKKFYDEHEHPLWAKQGELAQKVGGHGGMDFLMMWRVIYCLRNGEPLDQDVYDAAAWSSVFPLSEWSVNNRGTSIDFPDFTRGAWRTGEPLGIFDPGA
ncbi:Gfo/Idh/MocA family oxidoreductase [Kamptonema cortianum]|nr:Gfo/Idh/MocA family oxidoreductase [Geitlerinema splendidum]MDK3158559.1 Gfo/Idh/MocA family oxidoreductase [Kamptonema cortianum]